MSRFFSVTALFFLMPMVARAIDYPYSTVEPQKSGWPLTTEEREYVVGKPEHDRRPGREANKYLPYLWPVVPSAGHFGGDSWLKLHEAHVNTVQANAGPIDVLLVGDSITIQWGDSWKKHFPDLKAVNIGIGGDKTQNVLWRLDHGGVSGIQPKAIVLMIGNNNMFFTPETGIEAAARGIEMCVKNLREKFPQAKIVVAKILPAHAPGNRFYEDIKLTNASLDSLKLESDPKVGVLDLTQDFVNDDGTLKKDLYTPDNIHLSVAGYAEYAARLKPLLAAMLAGKHVPAQPMKNVNANVETTAQKPVPKPTAFTPIAPNAATSTLHSKPVVTYPYASYNEGKMAPQLTGWPLTAEALAWKAKGEYFRKPGHELQKHRPEMWFVTPTAAEGIKLCIDNLRQRYPQSRVLLIKVLPAFDPSKDVGAKVREINTALDALKLDGDPQVQLLDLWTDFTNSDGTLKGQLYSNGHLHLNLAGYEVLASRLVSIVIPQ